MRRDNFVIMKGNVKVRNLGILFYGVHSEEHILLHSIDGSRVIALGTTSALFSVESKQKLQSYQLEPRLVTADVRTEIEVKRDQIVLYPEL